MAPRRPLDPMKLLDTLSTFFNKNAECFRSERPCAHSYEDGDICGSIYSRIEGERSLFGFKLSRHHEDYEAEVTGPLDLREDDDYNAITWALGCKYVDAICQTQLDERV